MAYIAICRQLFIPLLLAGSNLAPNLVESGVMADPGGPVKQDVGADPMEQLRAYFDTVLS